MHQEGSFGLWFSARVLACLVVCSLPLFAQETGPAGSSQTPPGTASQPSPSSTAPSSQNEPSPPWKPAAPPPPAPPAPPPTPSPTPNPPPASPLQSFSGLVSTLSLRHLGILSESEEEKVFRLTGRTRFTADSAKKRLFDLKLADRVVVTAHPVEGGWEADTIKVLPKEKPAKTAHTARQSKHRSGFQEFGSDVERTFKGIGADLEEFFTGKRTIDR
jgi:hypothetical protein